MKPELGPTESTTPRSIDELACRDLETLCSVALGGFEVETARSVGCRNAQLAPRLHVPLMKNLQTSGEAEEVGLGSDEDRESVDEGFGVVVDRCAGVGEEERGSDGLRRFSPSICVVGGRPSQGRLQTPIDSPEVDY